MSCRAQASATRRPVATLPVKEILSSPAPTSAAPVSPSPSSSWNTPSGKPASRSSCSDELAGERRHFARLQQHRVARHQGLHGRVQREQEREVPRRDDPDHAERLVRDAQLLRLHQVQGHRAVGEDARGALRVELERVARGEDLGDERFLARLARLGDDDVEEVLLVLDQHAHRALEQTLSRAERSARPLRLRLPRALERFRDVGRIGDLDLADRLEASGTRESQATAPADAFGDGLEDRQPSASAHPRAGCERGRGYGSPAGKVNRFGGAPGAGPRRPSAARRSP